MSDGPPKTLMERLDRHEAMMAARLQSLRNTKEALEPLYAALDAQQKQKLDQMAGSCRSGWGAADDDNDD